jgi:quercetin dioxygenase-like cupin family protein
MVKSKPTTVIKSEDVLVRIMPLKPHESNEWHYHTTVTDNFFCLEGKVVVELKDSSESHILSPGQRCTVLPNTVHRVRNLVSSTSRYLLVQGVGEYDKIAVA